MSEIVELPDTVRDALPGDLQDAEMHGTDVASADESLRLYGGPGTGKSTQIGFRLAALHQVLGVSPGEMTVVTYRRSLADTVKNRLADEWGVMPDEPDLTSQTDVNNPYRFWGTVHAVAARTTGFLDSIDESRSDYAGMVDDKAMRAFCDEYDIMYTHPAPGVRTQWDVFYSLYTYARANLLDVGEWRYIDESELTALRGDRRAFALLQDYQDKWSVEFDRVVDVWESWKAEHGVHGFWEQLEAATQGTLPPMRVVAIDEYHDAYPLMARVVERWVEAAETVIVAGDPDQVVNAYAGADPRFFEHLASRVSKSLPVVTLPVSHRVPDEHMEAARTVLASERRPPDLETVGPGLIYRYSDVSFTQDDDNTWVSPNASVDGSPYMLWRAYGPDMMFLARMRSQVDAVGRALDEHGVVYKSQSDVAGDWEFRLALMRALRATQVVESPESYGDDGSSKLVDPSNVTVPELVDIDAEDALTLLQHTDKRYLSSEYGDIVDAVRDPEADFFFDEHVTSGWWSVYGAGRESIRNVTYVSDEDVTAMQSAWTRYEDADEWTVDDLASGTRLLTIHASKGAEASDVVVFDGISRRIRRSMRVHDESRENEARTWYVALTRASKRLHVVRDAFDFAQSYLPGGLEASAARAAAAAAAGDTQGDTA